MATAFDEITTGEIGVDADVDAATFTKIVNRGAHVKEIVSAASGAPKIPAQAIATQAAASGTGLRVTQFNHVVQTVAQVTAADGTYDITTAISGASVRGLLWGVTITGGGTYDFTLERVFKSTSSNVILRLIRAAGGAGTQTVTIDVYGIFL